MTSVTLHDGAPGAPCSCDNGWRVCAPTHIVMQDLVLRVRPTCTSVYSMLPPCRKDGDRRKHTGVCSFVQKKSGKKNQILKIVVGSLQGVGGTGMGEGGIAVEKPGWGQRFPKGTAFVKLPFLEPQ